jgi:hypothetical protein
MNVWRKIRGSPAVPYPPFAKMREEPALRLVEGMGHSLCGCVRGFRKPRPHALPKIACLAAFVRSVAAYDLIESIH